MKQHIITRALAAACALACAVSLAGCGASEEGKIRIGIKFDQPGLGFKKSGTYVGFDVDVATYIAEELGYTRDEIVWKEAPSAQREAMLQNGDVDMIIATYSITDSRKAVVDFAGPYFVAGQDLLVRDDETEINGPEDLNGKRLCSVTGSTSAVTVKEKFADEVQLMEQPGYAECATALFSGIVDAVTTDDIILAGARPAQGSRQAVHAGVLWRRHQEGPVRLRRADQRRDREDDRGRLLGPCHRGEHRGHRLQPEPRLQSADANGRGVRWIISLISLPCSASMTCWARSW